MTFYNGRYGLAFIVTENGNATAATVEEDLLDYERCSYFRDYIGNMSAYAAKNDIDVAAYFAWSLMDNYEWADGFTTRFGLTYVDYDSQVRTPEASAAWFQEHVNTLGCPPMASRCRRARMAAAHLLQVQQQQQQHSNK